MAVDEARYPHFGGRKRLDLCSVCGRMRPCVVIDTDEPDGELGETVCMTCLREAMDVAWDVAEEDRKRRRLDGR